MADSTVVVEPAFEVESGGKKEKILAGLVSEVEIAQEVIMCGSLGILSA